LLLDEPFSALDYQTRLSVCDDVYKIIRSEQKTALLITHDISEAISVADRILVLSKRPANVIAEHALDFQESEPLKRRENKAFSGWFEILWKELNV
jgi:NitT/TauT family transport system ATP-binding protein